MFSRACALRRATRRHCFSWQTSITSAGSGTGKAAARELLRKTEPNAEALWLGVRIERRLGNRSAEARYGNCCGKFPLSREAQELLKGNFE
jgi:Tfp pilus assembly protein PilF